MKTTKPRQGKRGRPTKAADKLAAKQAKRTTQSAKPTASARSAPPVGQDRPDMLVTARYIRPDKVELVFADGLSVVRSFAQLELNMDGMKLQTIKAGKRGTDLEVQGKRGGIVKIDSATLRALVDPDYAAEMEKSLLQIRGPVEVRFVAAK